MWELPLVAAKKSTEATALQGKRAGLAQTLLEVESVRCSFPDGVNSNLLVNGTLVKSFT